MKRIFAATPSIAHDNPTAGLSRYEISHLAEHLARAGLGPELHRLLSLETATNRNAWYETKIANADISGYMADLATARSIAETQPAQSRDSVGLKVRYALLASSAGTVVAEFPPTLLRSCNKTCSVARCVVA